jgi:hypothetical protein
MCFPFLNLFVWYDVLLRGWCVAYVGDASESTTQTTMRRYKYAIKQSVHIPLNILIFYL